MSWRIVFLIYILLLNNNIKAPTLLDEQQVENQEIAYSLNRDIKRNFYDNFDDIITIINGYLAGRHCTNAEMEKIELFRHVLYTFANSSKCLPIMVRIAEFSNYFKNNIIKFMRLINPKKGIYDYGYQGSYVLLSSNDPHKGYFLVPALLVQSNNMKKWIKSIRSLSWTKVYEINVREDILFNAITRYFLLLNFVTHEIPLDFIIKQIVDAERFSYWNPVSWLEYYFPKTYFRNPKKIK